MSAEGMGVAKKNKGRNRELFINVSDLRKRLGSSSVINIDVELERVKVVDTTAEGPVQGEVTLESIERGINARGSIVVNWEGSCRRCLDVVSAAQKVDIDENFQINAPKDSELIDFDGVHVDLLPVVVEAVAFSLPLAPLCSTGCKGPAPESYPAMSEEEAKTKPQTDPRWGALDQLRFD